MPLPSFDRLYIFGGLEIQDGIDNEIKAKIIYIGGTGRFVAGWPDEPFTSNLKIQLQGGIYDPALSLDVGLNVGSKAIGKSHYFFYRHFQN